MKFLSVCSGIEAASVAWNPLGWEATAFSEIEPFPCAVLAHHYPNVPNHGDMTQFKEWPDHAIDLLCGGTPCQSFSVAGLRKGLDDPRGNLMLTYGAIAAKYRPKWLVWENVPGVLSSNGGRDFGSFLGLLGQLGYGFAYRVLDAQYFGLAQRRRRVFVVGCLGDWRSAAAVLLERESLRGDSAPRREAGQGVAACLTSGAANGGAAHGARSGSAKDETLIAGTLSANGKAAGSATQQDAESGMLIAHSLRGEGFDASEDGTGRGTPLVPVGVDGFNASLTGTVAATMGTRGSSETASGPQVLVPVAFDTTQVTSAANRSNPQHGDPCHPIAAGAHAPAIAFDCKASGQNGFGVGEIASTQRAMGHAGSHTNGGGHQAVAYSTKLHNTTSNQAGKVYEEYTAGLDRNSPPPALLTAMQVRRLPPRECERLQGFPDDYTLIPLRNKKPSDVIKFAADGPRYKALGNSWAVPCARWIGERIEAVEAIHAQQRKAS